MDLGKLIQVDLAQSISLHESFSRNLEVRPARSQARWTKPDEGFIKINFDAATFRRIGTIGIGVVARNFCGNVIGWETDIKQGLFDTEIAESSAAMSALKMARDFGWKRVSFEGDCLSVIRKLQGEEEDSSRLGNVISDIRSLFRYFELFSFSFIYRKANYVADSLARNAASACIGSTDIPDYTWGLLVSDSA